MVYKIVGLLNSSLYLIMNLSVKYGFLTFHLISLRGVREADLCLMLPSNRLHTTGHGGRM